GPPPLSQAQRSNTPLPPAPCGESEWSPRGRRLDVPVGGPPPAGPRSPVASAPGTPTSASCDTAGSLAPPRSTSPPGGARPGTPVPSPGPATGASSAPRGAGRIAASALAGLPAWPAPWPSGTGGRPAGSPPPSTRRAGAGGAALG